jgi:hypothetical protein
VGFVGFGIVVALTMRVLIPHHMDLTFTLSIGEDAPEQSAYARALLGDVGTRPNFGHDGKFFFAQANDPWYLDPNDHAVVLDHPIYRAQRMLYPMLAGGFGAFPPHVVVWAMLLINLAAMSLGAAMAAKLAVFLGLSPWLGLWVPLNPGLLFELDIGGAGIVAYVCCLAALLLLSRERTWAAAAAFAAAALTREVMLAFAGGVFLLFLLTRHRSVWRIVAVPSIAIAVWNVYIRIRLAGIGGLGGGVRLFAPPFVGMVRAAEDWRADPVASATNLAIVLLVVAFLAVAFATRLPIAWGAIPFVAISLVLVVDVWREPFDLARAVVPVFTAVPFAAAVWGRGKVGVEETTRPEVALAP